jgi:hypothetical protein
MTTKQAQGYLRPDGIAYHTVPQLYFPEDYFGDLMIPGEAVAFWPMEGDARQGRTELGYIPAKLAAVWREEFAGLIQIGEEAPLTVPFSPVPVQGCWTLMPTPE